MIHVIIRHYNMVIVNPIFRRVSNGTRPPVASVTYSFVQLL